MAQLKVKQISDFVTAVGNVHNGAVGTDTATAIAGVQSAVDANAEAIALNTAKTGITSGQSSAIVANTSNIATEKGRIDALLLDSTAALNTFAEIETFITRLSTADVSQLEALSTAVSNDVVHSTAISTAVANDAVHSTAISANTSAIAGFGDIVASDVADFATADQGVLADSALQDATAFDAAGSADAAEANAIAHADGLAGNYDLRGSAAAALTSAKTYADTAESDAISTASSDATSKANAAQSAAISSAEAKDVSRASAAATALSTAIATEVSNRNTAIGVLDTDLQSQIDALAGVNNVEEIATFRTVTSFATTVNFDLNGHVAVFVNGLQVHEAVEDGEGWVSGNGQDFDVQGLGYNLEVGDHIIVSGKTV